MPTLHILSNNAQASNVATYIAHGDVALSVLMTTASTLGAIFMTPLLTKLLAGQLVPVDAAVRPRTAPARTRSSVGWKCGPLRGTVASACLTPQRHPCFAAPGAHAGTPAMRASTALRP